jgi:hypothetical protein
MKLSEDDKLWRDQNVPNVSDDDYKKMIDVFGDSGKDKDKDKDEGGAKRERKAPPIIEDVCIELMTKYRFLTIEETDGIWYFKEGVYLPGGEILIAKEAEKMYGYQQTLKS